MITLVVREGAADAAANRGINAVFYQQRPHEVWLRAPLSDERKVIDWFCEEGSPLLWYSVKHGPDPR